MPVTLILGGVRSGMSWLTDTAEREINPELLVPLLAQGERESKVGLGEGGDA